MSARESREKRGHRGADGPGREGMVPADGAPPGPQAADGSRARAAGADTAPPCGCAPGDHEGSGRDDGNPRRAVGVDPELKRRNLNRLRRIEGQVRGLQRMVEDDRYCAEILTQLSSVQEALRAVGRELMKNHLRFCATEAIRSGPGEAEEMYDELIELMYRHIR